ncbi:MAG: GNAT family N-acetyltransferase, partial [Anaerolineae bacterium]|nr:GNAT family N-acetyltransferase [Anaerolineae bacterium]
MTPDPHARTTWARILKTDLQSHAYVAEAADWPGAAVFSHASVDGFNLAVLQQTTPAEADALPARIAAHYRALGVTPRVRVTPLSAPTDWPARLQRHGWVEAAGEEVFMQLVGPLRVPPSPDVRVRQAPAEASLADVVRVQSEGFGGGGAVDEGVARAQQALARWDYLFLVASLDGQPVGAASARFEAGVCGVYGVATLEGFRRRGVSTTILHAVVDAAGRRGCDLVFLSAEPDGYARRLYARLGFVEVFHTYQYELPREGMWTQG